MPALPALPSLQQVSERLSTIFPSNFPDRTILVGELAARLFYVMLYGGFIDGHSRYVRPNTVMRFSDAQAALASDEERMAWLTSCHSAGHVPMGEPWYAVNSRETLRDDLIRNRAIPMGIIVKRQGLPPTSPAPIYALSAPFAALLDASLQGEALAQAITTWQERHLDPMTLKRMRLLAQGVKAKEGQVTVELPTTGKTLRLAPGDASSITKDVCEVLSKRLLEQPVVIHASISDQKLFKELEGEAEAVGLTFNPSAELPDVVMVDIGHDYGLVVAFIEVVHSDGPITELRKQALLRIAAEAGIAAEHVRLITAFDDRNAPAFKKRVSELARDSLVWFRSEPELILKLERLPER